MYLSAIFSSQPLSRCHCWLPQVPRRWEQVVLIKMLLTINAVNIVNNNITWKQAAFTLGTLKLTGSIEVIVSR